MINNPSFEILKRHKFIIAIRILTIVIVRACFLIIPILFGASISNIVSGNYMQAGIYAGVGLSVAVICRVFQICMSYMWMKLFEVLVIEYTSQAEEKIVDTKQDKNRGEIINILTQDIEIMASYFPSAIRMIIRTLEALVIFIYFFSIGYYIGFAGISATAFSLLILNITSKKIEKSNKKMLESLDERSSVINKILEKPKVAVIERLDESTKKWVLDYRKKELIEESSKNGVSIIIEVFRWAMIIMGIHLFIKGNIEVGVIVVIYSYYSQLIDSFTEISDLVIRTKRFKVSEKRLLDFIKRKKYKF